MATVRRKLGGISKQKAPGLTGNGPDLYAAQQGSWVEWAVVLFNVILHMQITPRGWHVDLVHYVHKVGNDGSLSNHRPLAPIEVLRKVFTGIAVDRMRRDWSRLKGLGECYPGFQAGRTTANAILPVRIAAEYCAATKTKMAVPCSTTSSGSSTRQLTPPSSSPSCDSTYLPSTSPCSTTSTCTRASPREMLLASPSTSPATSMPRSSPAAARHRPGLGRRAAQLAPGH